MRLLHFFLGYSRKTLIVSIVAGIVGGASNAAILAVVNSVLKSNGRATWQIIATFLGLCVVLSLSRYLSETLLTRLGQSALYKLRMHLSRQILAAQLRHLEQLGPTRILAALTDDAAVITNTIPTIPLLCVNVAVVASCLVYMGFTSPPLLALVAVSLALGIVSYQFPVLKAHARFRKMHRDGDALLGHLRALIQGVKELKLHSGRRDAFLGDVLEPTASSYREHNVAAMKIYTAASTWGQTLVFLVIGLILFGSSAFMRLNPGTLTAFTIGILYLMTPLQYIMSAVPMLARAELAIARIDELGFSLAGFEPDTVETPPAADAHWTTLELAGVTHSYYRDDDSSNFVLGPIDLTIRPRELVFITGGNGSGKTTLIKLLTGLYVPESGQLRLDGEALTPRTRERYRQHFSTVFSDFHIFERLLGIQGSNVDRSASDHLKRLELSHKVRVENGALSTTELSQGQRKRLALLIALLEDRSIYIFDEWAADQDPHFKQLFYLDVLPALKANNKTVIAITHDERFYHIADRVISLEDGQLISDTLNSASLRAEEYVKQ